MAALFYINIHMTINATYQTATAFSVSITAPDFEDVNLNIQDFKIPRMSNDNSIQSSKQLDIKRHGAQLQFEPLNVGILLNEGLVNVRKIHDWIVRTATEEAEEYYDVLVTGYGSNETPSYTVRFVNAFPIDINIDELSTTAADDSYLKAQVTFEYDFYEFI